MSSPLPSARPSRHRSLDFDTPPRLRVEAGQQGKVVQLSGQWTTLARDRTKSGVTRRLRAIGREAISQWDLLAVERLDHVGGQALWRVWGRRMPSEVELNDTQREIF